MLRHAALALLLAFPAIGVAEVDRDVAPFIKARGGDPNALGYLLAVAEECPIAKAEVQDTVEGVFIRSRLKPEAFTLHADSFLPPNHR
jgi:hypothetical protein